MNERLRVPLDPAYATAIGVAAYIFARLEWDAVWCCERMKAGYISELRKNTAGKIAKDLARLADALPASAEAQQLQQAAAEFERLVLERNALMHAKPGTAPDGQRLFREGTAWSIAAIEALADEFTACSIPLNAALYSLLKAPTT